MAQTPPSFDWKQLTWGHRVALCVGIAFVVMWPILNVSPQLKLRERECVGPVTDPSPRLEPWSRQFVDKLAAEMLELEQKKQVLDLIFLGDSITETWRGTDMGRACERCKGVPEVFKEYFLSRYPKTEVLAVGGDQVAHVEWRLMNGEMPIRTGPRAFVLMIGTNDLGAASCYPGEAPLLQAVPGVTARIKRLLDYIHANQPRAPVLLLGVLPRGGGEASSFYSWPSRFSAAIWKLNQNLRSLAKDVGFVTFLDCGKALTPDDQIDPNLMPDALHPGREGMELFARCILSEVEKMVK